MAPERKVPVLRSDRSFIDPDEHFSSVRDRFEQEMRKMEEEMNRFRGQLMERERDFFSRSPSAANVSAGRPADSYLEGLNSPLIQETGDGGKLLKLQFDVSQYAPEEIVVKTVDNRLQVHAKHEEKSDTKSVYREYNREFMLPQGTNPEDIRSQLSRDGVLTVEAPLPKQAIEYK